MKFVARVLLFPVVLLSAFLVLMLKWTLNLSAFVLALPMLYIFGCGLYTLYLSLIHIYYEEKSTNSVHYRERLCRSRNHYNFGV